MDSQLVSDSLSADEGGERNKTRSPFSTYTEQFYEVFPYYLAIGMTYEQFWDGDPILVKYYRQAEEIRNEKKNQELWLQGLYVYDAFCKASPILHAFAKKGVKPIPYPEKPYSITEKQLRRDEEEKEKRLAEKGKMVMSAWMHNANKRFAEKS